MSCRPPGFWHPGRSPDLSAVPRGARICRLPSVVPRSGSKPSRCTPLRHEEHLLASSGWSGNGDGAFVRPGSTAEHGSTQQTQASGPGEQTGDCLPPRLRVEGPHLVRECGDQRSGKDQPDRRGACPAAYGDREPNQQDRGPGRRRTPSRRPDPRPPRRPAHHRALRPRQRQPRHGVHFLTAYVAGV